MEASFHTCPLCEATCGLEIEVSGDEVTRVRGDRADVFSRGFLCPTGVNVAAIRADPGRVRTPLVRGADGELHPATWDEASAHIAQRLTPILQTSTAPTCCSCSARTPPCPTARS